ncbi:MAG: hypothetical protein ACKN9W_18445, partial [Methylococcus sp.]
MNPRFCTGKRLKCGKRSGRTLSLTPNQRARVAAYCSTEVVGISRVGYAVRAFPGRVGTAYPAWLTLLGFALDRPLGIDIEKPATGGRHWQRIADYGLSLRERDRWQSLSAARQVPEFLKRGREPCHDHPVFRYAS